MKLCSPAPVRASRGRRVTGFDTRGAIDDADAGIRVLQVKTERASDVVAPGTLYLPLDQPLAAVIAAALEPDSQSSYAANRMLDLEASGLRRVMAKPAPHML